MTSPSPSSFKIWVRIGTGGGEYSHESFKKGSTTHTPTTERAALLEVVVVVVTVPKLGHDVVDGALPLPGVVRTVPAVEVRVVEALLGLATAAHDATRPFLSVPGLGGEGGVKPFGGFVVTTRPQGQNGLFGLQNSSA